MFENLTFSAIFAMLIFPSGLMALTIGLIFKGIDRKITARLQRRIGPPILQPFFDIAKLSLKETLIPETANAPLFKLAPLMGLAGMLLAAALIPVAGFYAGIPYAGDLIVLLYLLPFPALSYMLAGAASSSPFGAIGFSREMVITFCYEIPLMAVLLAVAFRVGTFSGQTAVLSLERIVSWQLENGPLILDPIMWPSLLVYLVFVPATLNVGLFDIPEAESEILEGALLEYSGPLLGLFQLMGAVKLMVVLGLGVSLFCPLALFSNPILNGLVFIAQCGILMIVTVSLFRVATGRLKMDQAFNLLLKYLAGLAFAGLLLVHLLR